MKSIMKKLLYLFFVSLFYCNLFCTDVLHADTIVMDNPPTINPDLVEVMPWLGGKAGLNEVANRNIPLFAGDKVPEDFGESQYDKDIPWMQLQNKSLDEIRAEKKKTQEESIINNIVIGSALIILIVILFKMSQKK